MTLPTYLAGLIVLTCALFAEAASAPSTRYSTPAPGIQVAQTGVGFDYWIYLPQDYESQTNVPLVLFLHGIGAKDLGAIKAGAPPEEVDQGRHFPFVLVSPFWNGQWWSAGELVLLVDAIATQYKIDPQRIYVTGLSMGGYGTWDIASRYPEHFAAIAPVCGGGDPRSAARLKTIPTWAYHGAKDNTVPITESRKMVDALEAAGGDVKFTVFPNAAHVCWPEVYGKGDVYEWMLSHRKPAPAPIDRLALGRYYMQKGVRFESSPLLSDDDTSKGLSSTVLLSNTLDAPVQIRGRFGGNLLQVDPPTFDLRLDAQATHTMHLTVKSSTEVLADSAGVDARWTVAGQPAPLKSPMSIEFRRQLPISRVNPCRRLSAPVTIDGNLEDWNSGWVDVSGPGATNPRARVAIAADGRAIYAAVRVIDGTTFVPATKPVWDKDGIEVRFDFRKPPRSASFRDWQEVLPILVSPGARDDEEPTIWRPEALPEGTRIASRLTAQGYDTEIEVPMSYAVAKHGGEIGEFRVNVCVDDTDGNKSVTKHWWHPDWRMAPSDDGRGSFRASSADRP